MKIGPIIKLWRESLGQGLRTFAREIGISHGTLKRIERGEEVDGSTLMKLWKWLFD